MAKTSIKLGKSEDQLKILFAYPNTPNDNESLSQTIMHWFGQTLFRDGLTQAPDAADKIASVRNDGGDFYIDLDGPSDSENAAYAERFPRILEFGWEAWTGPIVEIKNRKVWGKDTGDESYPMWDPCGTGHWRFFLTLGVGIVNHRTLQFFHYPPERLLNPLRDSMEDPVTYRCRDLLEANGVSSEDTKYYETRINSTPIAAPDDQGTNFSAPADPVWGGLIPIGYFRDFERNMIRTLIKPHPDHPGYTIPMTAYGNDPRQRFGGMFLNPDKAMILEVVPGLKTPVLGSNHPYNFFYTAQASDGVGLVGSGKMIDSEKVRSKCTLLQQEDLAVVRWQVKMAEDPSQDPWEVIEQSRAFWKDEAQQAEVCALVKRHASLTYADPAGNKFSFALSMEDARKECGA